ncbi:MAG: hypothetical protein IKG58_01975 [Bacilli bacterium]|nr:hypothetical protein [Bacilli bacterium]MBR3049314.1 hypothetical protein [Bacilli bacterium]
MDNLLSIGIKQSIIDKMLEENDEVIVANLDYNFDTVARILKKLSFLDSKVLSDILIYYNDIFFIDYEDFEKRFNSVNIDLVKDDINRNPLVLYEILNIA